MAEAKTNAVRMLETAHIPFQTHSYEKGDGIDGISVAAKLGQPLERVFKTLVTQGKGQCFVFVIPVGKELDRKAAARAVGEKAIDMLPLKDLTKMTGYIRGGCSPVGMKKLFRTVIDQSAEAQKTIYVSGGRIGLQIEVEPQALAKLIGAEFEPVATEDSE